MQDQRQKTAAGDIALPLAALLRLDADEIASLAQDVLAEGRPDQAWELLERTGRHGLATITARASLGASVRLNAMLRAQGQEAVDAACARFGALAGAFLSARIDANQGRAKTADELGAIEHLRSAIDASDKRHAISGNYESAGSSAFQSAAARASTLTALAMAVDGPIQGGRAGLTAEKIERYVAAMKERPGLIALSAAHAVALGRQTSIHDVPRHMSDLYGGIGALARLGDRALMDEALGALIEAGVDPNALMMADMKGNPRIHWRENTALAVIASLDADMARLIATRAPKVDYASEAAFAASHLESNWPAGSSRGTKEDGFRRAAQAIALGESMCLWAATAGAEPPPSAANGPRL